MFVEVIGTLKQVNNSIAKWRLSAPDTQELPLLAASSYMETAFMAGKSRQPSHVYSIYTVEKGEGGGGGEQPRNYART